MPPGKLAAQAGHAYTDALWACLDQAPDQALAYRTTGLGGSKVTIQSKNLGQLERAARECAEAGIPHAVVTDADHVLLPHFTGAPIVTALGIGPVTRAQCRHITKRFQSVQGQAPEAHVMDPAKRASLLETMRSCEQTSGLTVLAHGEMVRDHYRDLMDHLRFGSPLRGEWRLPDWIHDPLLVEGLPSSETMAEYHVFHDCGKPVCRTVDAEGRQHFPDHAAVSARVWADAGGDPDVGDLIAMDMDVHLLKAEDVEAFSQRPEACALLLTALSEVHANASMFGGIQSTSFKIKAKHVEKRGRAILKAIASREALPMAA
jgi:peptidyl-tRNA hydrolase